MGILTLPRGNILTRLILRPCFESCSIIDDANSLGGTNADPPRGRARAGARGRSFAGGCAARETESSSRLVWPGRGRGHACELSGIVLPSSRIRPHLPVGHHVFIYFSARTFPFFSPTRWEFSLLGQYVVAEFFLQWRSTSIANTRVRRIETFSNSRKILAS